MAEQPTRQPQAPAGELPLLAAGFVLLWNSGFIGAEFGLPHTQPFTLLFWRYAALSVLLVALVAARRGFKRVAARNFGRIALVGILSHGVWLSCVLLALDAGVPAGIVALVVALQPLLTGALSGAATGERTSTNQWIGLALGFAGVAVAVGARLSTDRSISAFGYLIPFGSAAAITIASLIQRRSAMQSRATILPIDLQLLIQCVATTIAVALPALFLESLQTEWVGEFVLTMAWLIIAVSLGAYTLMWRLLDRIDATRVASLFYLGPPVTMVMAWIAFGDTLIATDIVGLVVAAGGVAIVSMRKQ